MAPLEKFRRENFEGLCKIQKKNDYPIKFFSIEALCLAMIIVAKIYFIEISLSKILKT